MYRTMVKQIKLEQLTGVSPTKVRSEPTSTRAVATLVPPPVPCEEVEVYKQPRLGEGCKKGRVKSVTGPKRGVAGGLTSNRRQLHEVPLRREPTLGAKLACAAKVAELVDAWGSRDRVPRSHTEFLEKTSGWMWKRQLRWWYEGQKWLALKLAELKIGAYGLRPFGS